MTMIEIDLIRPAHDAVQTADKLQKDANNHFAWHLRDAPGNSDQIYKAERALRGCPRAVYAGAVRVVCKGELRDRAS